MPSNYDEIDVEFGWNGDFQLSGSKDIKDTSDNALQSILDQIHSICASAFEDWEIYPGRAVGFNDFLGEANTKSTGDKIHDRVRIGLISAGIVAEQDLEVRVVPVHIHKILIVVHIAAIATAFNDLQLGEMLKTALVFDSMEQTVFFLDKTPILTAQ